MKLTYQAFDKTGRQVADTIEAGDSAEATEALRRRGLYVTEIAAGERSAPPAGAGGRGRTRPRRLKSVALLTSQLHVLVSCGTPLVEALGALARQTTDRGLRTAIADVQKRVEEGISLSAAMECHPQYFTPIYRSLIAAGEASGNLAGMLERLAGTVRKQVRVRNALLGAMIYPILLTVVATGVLTLMFIVVIPRFGELFKSLDVPLPPTTQALVTLSEALFAYWYLAVLAIVAPAVGIPIWLATRTGRRMLENLILALPQVGGMVRSFTTARIIRLLGVLLEADVPILEAIDLTRRSVRSHRYDALLARTQDAITSGDTITSVWSRSNLISPSVQEVVRNGERTGRVSLMLLSAAEFMDEENELIVRSLTSIVEPVILIVMGMVVGLVAVSLFMPLFDLTSMTQGGAP